MSVRIAPRAVTALATAAALAFIGSMVIAAIGAEFTVGSMARYEAAIGRTDITVNQFAELVKLILANLIPVGLAFGLMWFAGYAATDFVPEVESGEGIGKVLIAGAIFVVAVGGVITSVFYWLNLFDAVGTEGFALVLSQPLRLAPIPIAAGMVIWYATISYGRSALHRAAREGAVDIVKELLRSGADPNRRVIGQTPLEAAATAGSVDSTVALLEGGAEPTRGAPLVLAARGEHWSLIPVLLERGCQPNQFSGDRTALHIAAKEGQRDVVKMLIESGADPALQTSDEHGLNALHYAALYDQVDVVEYLLSIGVAKYARSKDDRTALDFARIGEGKKKALARLQAEEDAAT